MERLVFGGSFIRCSSALVAMHMCVQAAQAAETPSVTAEVGLATSGGELDANLSLGLTFAGVSGFTSFTLLSNPHETAALTTQTAAFSAQRNLGTFSNGQVAAGLNSSYTLYPAPDNSIFRVAPYVQWSMTKSALQSTTVSLTYEHDQAKGLGPDYQALTLKLERLGKLGKLQTDTALQIKRRKTEGQSALDTDYTVDASLTYPFSTKTSIKLEANVSDGLTEVELPTQVLRLDERNLTLTLSLPISKTVNGRPATISPYAKYDYSDVGSLPATRSAEIGLTFQITF